MLQIMPKKVLIVEDNELNMKLFADLLEAHGYETKQTREGLKAISLARSFKPSHSYGYSIAGSVRFGSHQMDQR